MQSRPRHYSYVSLPLALVCLTGCVCLSGCASLGHWSPLKPLERSMIYRPAQWPESFEPAPNANLEEAWFESEDGTQLHGLFAEHPKPRAVALLCHGNAGNVAGLIETLTILNRQHRLSVLAFDYRGYGRSEGSPSESGILSDARAARAWLAERSGVDESEIIMMGRSLGGAVAIDLAARDGAKALVVASTFTSLPDVAAEHFKWLPAKWMMTERLASIDKLKHYPGPLLQVHGKSDRLISIEQGRRLFETATGRKRFIEFEGGHNDPLPDDYRSALEELLRSLESDSPSGHGKESPVLIEEARPVLRTSS